MSVALVYCRVSTEDQADRGVSLDVQEADCRAWCAREGFEVELYVDAGRSGRTLERPGLQQLLGRLPEAAALVVWRLDRLSRDAVDQGMIRRECRRRGVRLVAVQQPEAGNDTPEADLVGTVLAGVGEFESALLGARVKAAQDRIAAGGRPLTAPPYGYDRDWQPVPAEAEAVHLIDRLYLAGLGFTRIAQELNRQGIPSPRGGGWWPSAVRHVLTRSIYAGELTWGRSRIIRGKRTWRPEQPATTVPATVPPIRDTATWERIQRLMEARTVGVRTGPATYPFTPVLRCGQCGSRMTGRTWHTRRGVPVRAYRCQRAIVQGEHPAAYLREEQLIEETRRFLESVLAGDSIALRSEDVDRAEIDRELTDLDRRRDRLVRAYTAEAITLTELEEHTARLQTRRAVLEERLREHAGPGEPIPAEQAAAQLTMPDNLDALRAWVLQVISEIRWDGEYLDIHLHPITQPSREAMQLPGRTVISTDGPGGCGGHAI